jgi:hypothetical protein
VEVVNWVTHQGKQVQMVINHAPREHTYVVPWSAFEHFTNQAVQNELKLLPYDVLLLSKTD